MSAKLCTLWTPTRHRVRELHRLTPREERSLNRANRWAVQVLISKFKPGTFLPHHRLKAEWYIPTEVATYLALRGTVS